MGESHLQISISIKPCIEKKQNLNNNAWTHSHKTITSFFFFDLRIRTSKLLSFCQQKIE